MESTPDTAAPAGSSIEVKTEGHFVAVLDRLAVSLAVSTPGYVLFLGGENGALTLNGTRVTQPMGLSYAGGRMVMGLARSVVVFANASRLAAHFPPRNGYHDAFFVPRAMLFTGECLMHDIVLSGRDILAANTNFSCVCRVDGVFSFTPVWQPAFITALLPEDRCHLNGLALEDGKPRYATSLAATDTKAGWREQSDFGGTLIDVAQNRILRADLCMPHSPRLVGKELYLLNAGMGELLRIDRTSGASTVLASLPGFAHGLAEHGGVLFVGLSQNRVTRKDRPPPVAQRAGTMIAGIAAVEAATGQVLGTAQFESGVTEVYDVQALPGIRRAGMQSLSADGGFSAVETPNMGLWVRREGKQQARLQDTMASGNYPGAGPG